MQRPSGTPLLPPKSAYERSQGEERWIGRSGETLTLHLEDITVIYLQEYGLPKSWARFPSCKDERGYPISAGLVA